MHLLPGLTAIALAAVAVLVRPSRRRSTVPDGAIPRSPARRALTGRPALVLGGCAVIVTLIVAGASLSRQGIADIYRSRAQSELASNPGAALTDVNRSLDIDSDVVQSYYVKAAALARFDEASTAEAALDSALELEPGNFVTWALLGDIATREHRPTAARRYYLRAHLLNPRDGALRELALGPGV
jgi:tetratricopeptide (TPR) repeat protein